MTVPEVRLPGPRVVVIGSSCSGKSTFAELLASQRGCARIELDELYWGPSWTPKAQPEFRRLVEEAAAAESWVAAGNYSVARPALWPRATTIVWLNYGLPLLLCRGLRRTLSRSLGRTVLFHGNRESLRRSFMSRDSILLWIVTTFHRRRRDFAALRSSGEYRHLTWLEARNPAEAESLLCRLRHEA
jgi:adenylate kinase family enzyme